MCYNVNYLKKRSQILAQRYGQNFYWPEPMDYNGFGHPEIAVVDHKNPGIIQPVYWGLIPSKSLTKKLEFNTLNARLDELQDKSSYKDCIQNRCLIWVSSYIDHQWTDLNNEKCKKNKYYLRLRDSEATPIAGIYNIWTDPNTGEEITTCTMCTAEAVGIAAVIHNSALRMPVVLNAEEESRWLDGENHLNFEDRKHIDLIAEPVGTIYPLQTSLF